METIEKSKNYKSSGKRLARDNRDHTVGKIAKERYSANNINTVCCIIKRALLVEEDPISSHNNKQLKSRQGIYLELSELGRRKKQSLGLCGLPESFRRGTYKV